MKKRSEEQIVDLTSIKSGIYKAPDYSDFEASELGPEYVDEVPGDPADAMTWEENEQNLREDRKLYLAQMEELRKKKEAELAENIRKYGVIDYGRFGKERLNYMRGEQRGRFFTVLPETYQEEKAYLDKFNEQCNTVYDAVVKRLRSDPQYQYREGDAEYNLKIDAAIQSIAEEEVRMTVVYAEENGFADFPSVKTRTWEEFLQLMRRGGVKETPEVLAHWRFLFEHYQKRENK